VNQWKPEIDQTSDLPFAHVVSQGDVDWRLELPAQFDAHSPVCQLIGVSMKNGK
jgi:hypothetical protein